MKAQRRSYRLLVTLAIVMILGHVCGESLQVHAGVITTDRAHESHSGATDSRGDAVHVASCDAVKAAPPAAGALGLLAIGTVLVIVSPPPRRSTDAQASVVVGSPPLFLLHAALLI